MEGKNLQWKVKTCKEKGSLQWKVKACEEWVSL